MARPDLTTYAYRQAQAHADLAQAQYKYGLALNELTAAVGVILYVFLAALDLT